MRDCSRVCSGAAQGAAGTAAARQVVARRVVARRAVVILHRRVAIRAPTAAQTAVAVAQAHADRAAVDAVAVDQAIAAVAAVAPLLTPAANQLPSRFRKMLPHRPKKARPENRLLISLPSKFTRVCGTCRTPSLHMSATAIGRRVNIPADRVCREIRFPATGGPHQRPSATCGPPCGSPADRDPGPAHGP